MSGPIRANEIKPHEIDPHMRHSPKLLLGSSIEFMAIESRMLIDGEKKKQYKILANAVHKAADSPTRTASETSGTK